MPLTHDATLSLTTAGLLPTSSSSSFDQLITQGLLPFLRPGHPPLAASELDSSKIAEDFARVRNSVAPVDEAFGLLSLFDLSGHERFFPASPNSRIPLGDSVLSFDPNTLLGSISPPLSTTIDALQGVFEDSTHTYTGADMRILLEIADQHLLGKYAKLRLTKQLLECTTLTVSVHREKSPVRAFGYINPKGYARGKRTIAGTLILTQFTVDALFRFLQAVLSIDLSKDTHLVKVDQLPPVNLTLLFSDEYGNSSYRRLLGVEFVTDGTVYSVNDMLTEQTVSYVASDFTPLLPVTLGTIFQTTAGSRTAGWERTVADVLAEVVSGRRDF